MPPLALAADGVIIGSRLVLTTECAIHENVRKTLVEARIYDTCLVMKSVGMTHRVLVNEASMRVREVEAKGGGLEDMLPLIIDEQTQMVYFEGDTDAKMLYVSQAVGLMHDTKPAGDVIREMVEQARQRFAAFTG